MKTRNGFVSNSSSSSFIIGSKVRLTKEKISELVGVSSAKPPFDVILKDIVETIHGCIGSPMSMEWFVKDRCLSKKDATYKTLEKLFEKGFFVYAGHFSDEGDAAEAMLCNTSLNHDDDDFFIEHDGGY